MTVYEYLTKKYEIADSIAKNKNIGHITKVAARIYANRTKAKRDCLTLLQAQMDIGQVHTKDLMATVVGREADKEIRGAL